MASPEQDLIVCLDSGLFPVTDRPSGAINPIMGGVVRAIRDNPRQARHQESSPPDRLSLPSPKEGGTGILLRSQYVK